MQGPTARSRLHLVAPDVAGIGRFHVEPFDWEGAPCLIAGTGYTGEDGVEVAVPVSRAVEFWQTMLETGFQPAGLGARDTLRLEAALPLHGHELGPGITPLQAGLGWVVSWDKGDFRGRAALDAERERGVARRLRALVVEGRRPPRAEQPVLVDGEPAGVVTSGNFSPVLEQGIALAFLPPEVEIGRDGGDRRAGRSGRRQGGEATVRRAGDLATARLPAHRRPRPRRRESADGQSARSSSGGQEHMRLRSP